MKMRNALWSLCVVLLLTLLLAGCAQTAAPAPAADTQNQTAPVIPMSSPEDITPHPIGSSSAPSDTVPASSDVAPASSDSFPEQPDSEPAPSEEDGIYLLVNGVRLAPGMDYAERKAALGAPSAPDQALDACDGSSFGTIHFYPGMTVTENESGVIRGIECSVQFEGESDAALLGRVGLGATRPEVLAALGVPENAASADLDCVLSYRQEGLVVSVCFFDADSPDTVSSISLTQIDTELP